MIKLTEGLIINTLDTEDQGNLLALLEEDMLLHVEILNNNQLFMPEENTAMLKRDINAYIAEHLDLTGIKIEVSFLTIS